MDGLRLNRTRDCRCCGKKKYRVLVIPDNRAPAGFAVAICPDCDMTTGKMDPGFEVLR